MKHSQSSIYHFGDFPSSNFQKNMRKSKWTHKLYIRCKTTPTSSIISQTKQKTKAGKEEKQDKEEKKDTPLHKSKNTTYEFCC